MIGYEKYDLIITSNKHRILKEISLQKKICKTKIMTIEEFNDAYFGTYDSRALYYLVDKYDYKCSIAKKYLDNIFFDVTNFKTIYNELESEKLLIKNPLFKKRFQKVLVDGYESIDQYVMKELKKYDVDFTKKTIGKNHPTVLEFQTIEEEIEFTATSILELLKQTSISNIYLVDVTSEYINPIKRIFELYKIPINIDKTKSIYNTALVQKFLKELRCKKSVKEALIGLEKNEVYNLIVQEVNKYAFVKNYTEKLYECIKYSLQKATIIVPDIQEAINIIADNEIVDTDKYYFVLGLNQSILPQVYNDEDIISDHEKKQIGILTSVEKTIIRRNEFINNIMIPEHIQLSYKKETVTSNYYPSSIIEELNWNVKKEEIMPYYSNIVNKLQLSKKLDNLIKYNSQDKMLSILFNKYNDIPYRNYDNSYTKINNDQLKKYLNNQLLLSYSSLDNYFKCGFRYYINNILKLSPIEENLGLYIGNIFHYVLSKMYDENFQLDSSYNEYLKDKELSKKELFFLDNLKDELKEIINVIKLQDTYSLLDKTLTEQKIYISKSTTVKFMGIIDKIRYQDCDGICYAAIIDYKTGSLETNLDNINYGLNLQLPIYIYLTNKGLNKDINIIGFYLQKILDNKEIDIQDSKESKQVKLKLDGFSNSNQNILSKIDKSYKDSFVIKSMKMTSDGFYKYAKVISDKEIMYISNLVDNKISEAIDNIESAHFEINPKRIENDLIGCRYCTYQDICYRKEEDIKTLENKKFEDIIGGDTNA